jgi:hypothetical protein
MRSVLVISAAIAVGALGAGCANEERRDDSSSLPEIDPTSSVAPQSPVPDGPDSSLPCAQLRPDERSFIPLPQVDPGSFEVVESGFSAVEPCPGRSATSAAAIVRNNGTEPANAYVHLRFVSNDGNDTPYAGSRAVVLGLAPGQTAVVVDEAQSQPVAAAELRLVVLIESDPDLEAVGGEDGGVQLPTVVTGFATTPTGEVNVSGTVRNDGPRDVDAEAVCLLRRAGEIVGGTSSVGSNELGPGSEGAWTATSMPYWTKADTAECSAWSWIRR